MNIRSKSGRSAAVLVLMLSCAQVPASYDSNDPRVLELTSAAKVQPFERGDPVPVGALPADAASAITAAPEIRDSGPGMVPLLDPDDKTAYKLEKQHIAAEAGAVQRTGKKLVLKTQAGKPIEFVDRKAAPSKNSDADSKTFIYAGRLGAGNYYRVEERFEQGPPGTFLVNPADGSVAFADYGEEVLAASPDGSRLMTVATNDLLVTVATLGADGPKVELACHYSDGPQIAFKGWHGSGAFDLVLSSVPPSDDAKPGLEVPIRLSLQADAWSLGSSNAAALTKWGFVCRRGAR